MSAAATNLLRQTDISAAGVADGQPFVPGSQIKGVLRHQCERLAVALNLDTVDPHAGTEQRGLRLTQHFQPLAKSSLLIDRLFGTRYQGECLFVTNALPLDSDRCSATAITTRIAIDRVTGTVMERHLFTTELADGEIDLRGQIRARHPAAVLTQDDDGFPYEYSLLVAGILSLDTFGGDKSVGMGRCKMSIEAESLRWNDGEVAARSAEELRRSRLGRHDRPLTRGPDMTKVRVHARLLAPLVIKRDRQSERSAGVRSASGTVVRGALASSYLQRYGRADEAFTQPVPE